MIFDVTSSPADAFLKERFNTWLIMILWFSIGYYALVLPVTAVLVFTQEREHPDHASHTHSRVASVRDRGVYLRWADLAHQVLAQEDPGAEQGNGEGESGDAESGGEA